MVYELVSQSKKLNKWGGVGDGGRRFLLEQGWWKTFLKRTEREGDAHQGRVSMFLKL